jgi:hypothetical protein
MTRRSFPDPVADGDVIDELVEMVHSRFHAARDATIPGRMPHPEPDA